MVSISDLMKMESILRQGQNVQLCGQYVQKLRTWLAAGQSSPEVHRRLEQLVARFGNARFAGTMQRPQ